MSGFFLTIEGGHACGKTLLRQALVKELTDKGFTVTDLIDVGATQLGQQIRNIWLEDPTVPVDYLTEAFLICASRRQNVVEIIRPGLEVGQVVISERFNDAMLAFQGYGRNVSIALLQVLADAVAEEIEPDYTVLLDIPSDEVVRRLSLQQRHRIEKLPIDFHERLRQGYLEIARQNVERIHIYDAMIEPKRLMSSVLENIWPLLYAATHG